MKTAGASEKAPPFHKTKDKTERVGHSGKVQSQNRASALRMVHPPSSTPGHGALGRFYERR